MKTTTIKNFGGLTYVSVSKVPIRPTEFGDVIDMEQGELERLVAVSLIENRVPVRGAEFRVMKSALALSNDAIADYLGVNRNTVLKWGKEIEKRLPKPYEILVRLLVADLLGIELDATLEDLSADDKAKKISLKAA
jgi:DNA-binding transcriptional regulator YiaG